MDICSQIHNFFYLKPRLKFPFNEAEIPSNGIYVLFEKGESGHQRDRIVRVGSHTGENRLYSRLYEHFIKENKNRSIFRKNIGRAILNKNNDFFLGQWELCLTSKVNRSKYTGQVDFAYQKEIEEQVSEYIRSSFSFIVFKIVDKKLRLALESKLISTISLCGNCKPSRNWLGLHSPKKKIRESGLWNEHHLYKTLLSENEIKIIMQS
ncbi:MAG: hypothetical protein ISS71_07915 [Phycisphaerae bacterium]|nr:hypothetical protein [Phycisphaerae bacterium]